MALGLIKEVFAWLFGWHTTSIATVYQFYNEYSRPILDIVHTFFELGFSIILIVTGLLATAYLVMGMTVIFKKKAVPAEFSRDSEPVVTVQIPTYNELAALNCAKRALDFDWPANKLQIIIGDDSNDAEVSARIDAFAARYSSRVLVTRRGRNIGFKPGNLNHMLKFTKGEFIAIFDSDFLPAKDFLRKAMAPFENSMVSVVQARWNIANFKQNIFSVLGGTISLLCHYITLEFINMIRGVGFLCGSAEIIRYKDLVEAGGWRMGSLTEDIECSLRLITAGKKLVYLEDVECDCEAPYRFRDLCRQQMRWAYGVMEALKIHSLCLFTSSKTSLRSKIGVVVFASGYAFSGLLLLITFFGLFSVISNRPAPIDWSLFLSQTARNIIFTSGFVLASIVALTKGKQVRELPRMIAGSLSIGLLVTYYVNVGLFKALFSRSMPWFILSKKGNETTQ